MNISKPEYYISDIVEKYKDIEFKSKIEEEITICLMDILEDSSKYLFSDSYQLYVNEFKDIKADLDLIDFFTDKNLNVSVEYFDELINKEVLINIIDSDHPLLKKILLLLGKDESEIKRFKAMFYYNKDDDEWKIPIESICLDIDNKKSTLDIFTNKTFNMKNTMQSDDENKSKGSLIDSLFDMFNDLLNIVTNKKMEFILVPPTKSKKKRKSKRYYYKVSHIFLRKPESVIKNNEAEKSKLIYNKNKFNENINKIKDKMFF